MTNKELMECIAAEEAGKKIECRVIGPKYGWARKEHSGWNTGTYEYRIAAAPEYYARTCRCGATIYCDKRYRPICGICGAHL